MSVLGRSDWKACGRRSGHGWGRDRLGSEACSESGLRSGRRAGTWAPLEAAPPFRGAFGGWGPRGRSPGTGRQRRKARSVWRLFRNAPRMFALGLLDAEKLNPPRSGWTCPWGWEDQRQGGQDPAPREGSGGHARLAGSSRRCPRAPRRVATSLWSRPRLPLPGSGPSTLCAEPRPPKLPVAKP